MNKRAIGTRMEEIAARWLEERGCRILARQYRTRAGEVDLIYEEGGVLVFAEVKYRTSLRYGAPNEAVDERKQRHIVMTAMGYMQKIGNPDMPVRFDVIELIQQNGRLYIRQIRGAFLP